MRRREFIVGLGGAGAWPLAARAQQAQRMRRVGVLTFGFETGPGGTLIRLLRGALEQLGWREGRNLQLDFRFGDGDASKTSAFAADLVQLVPDVIEAAHPDNLPKRTDRIHGCLTSNLTSRHTLHGIPYEPTTTVDGPPVPGARFEGTG